MRKRILARARRPAAEVLTLGPAPDSERRRAALLEQGALVEGIVMLNIYEHYREHGWGDEPPGEPLDDLSRARERGAAARGRPVLRIVHRYPRRRPQGLRLPARATGARSCACPRTSSPTGVVAGLDPAGRRRTGAVCGEFASLRAWHRRWLRELTPDDERVFVFTDSRFVVPHLAPLRDPRMRLLYQMHNLHLQPPARRWDGPMAPALQAGAQAGGRRRRDGHADRAPARRDRRCGAGARPTCSSSPTRSTMPPAPEPSRRATRCG